MSAAKRIEVQLSIGDEAWRAVTARVVEGMSELGGAWVEIGVGEDIDLERLIEEEAALVVTWEGREARRFTMQLARVRFLDERDGHLRYELELRPSLWFLGLDKNTRKFRDERTEAIASRVLDECRVRHAWRTTRQADSQPYCVQYRETNLDFVKRLLEFEGFYYTFDPDGTMSIGDQSSASPDVEGGAEYALIEVEGALAHGEFGITSFERGAAVGSGKATVNDYNWKKPKLSLLKSATAERDAHLEIYEYPTGYRDPDTGAKLAALRLEALVATKRFVEGAGTVPTFAPARLFTFAHEEALSFSGRFLLMHVEHSYREEQGVTVYENSFRAIPEEVPFRPPLVTPYPVVAGNHTAMVRGPAGEEIHTDPYGRAKVQFHWDREATGTDDSRWIRTLQEISTSIALARVGWEMSIGYIDGDPERPVGLARQVNGQMIPTYSQPALRNRMTIRTETYPGKQGFNELRMEDSAGSMTMDWHAQKDLKNLVRHDRTETIGNNLTVGIQHTSNRTVAKNQTYRVGGNENRTVGRDSVVMVEKDRTSSIGGSETIDVTAEASVAVDGDQTERVGGSRITQAGNADAGSIDRSTQERFTRIVGSAAISQAGGSITHEAGEMLRESVGGSKTTMANEQSIKQAVRGSFTYQAPTVMRKSKGDMSVSAKKSKVDIGASARWSSEERVELRGRAIEITAADKLALVGASSSVEMTPGKVTMKGAVKLESSGKITVRGNPEKLTK